jgi:hypothetical protein
MTHKASIAKWTKIKLAVLQRAQETGERRNTLDKVTEQQCSAWGYRLVPVPVTRPTGWAIASPRGVPKTFAFGTPISACTRSCAMIHLGRLSFLAFLLCAHNHQHERSLIRSRL